MSEQQQQVLDCLKEIGPCGFRTVAKTLDMDDDHVKEIMEALLADGYAKRQSNKQWIAVKTSKPQPGHPWRKSDGDYTSKQLETAMVKDKPATAAPNFSAKKRADDATIEFYVRLRKGIWSAGGDTVLDWDVNRSKFNTDGVIVGATIHRHKFEACAERLVAEWKCLPDPKLGVYQWMYRGILREPPQTSNISMPPTGPTVNDLIESGHLSKPLESATTDELIELVHQAEKAREIIRQRVESIL